ncbi:unnamed protein product [Polarella glacialis]|uniref:C2 domain-containing protein n=1 Tax=Polarella glacialis TaxID=89957 RepID=A0A813J9J6_POLGL|nr:unnamed protein product [Polarella glacialis]
MANLLEGHGDASSPPGRFFKLLRGGATHVQQLQQQQQLVQQQQQLVQQLDGINLATSSSPAPSIWRSSLWLWLSVGLLATFVMVALLCFRFRSSSTDEGVRFLAVATTEEGQRTTSKERKKKAQEAAAAASAGINKPAEEAEAAEKTKAEAEAAKRVAAEAAEKKRADALAAAAAAKVGKEKEAAALALEAQKQLAKAKAKAAVAKKAARVYFLFETLDGASKTVTLTKKPIGFQFRVPTLRVRQVMADSEADQQGVKEGWRLRQWGSQAGSLEDVQSDDKAIVRSKLTALMDQFPGERRNSWKEPESDKQLLRPRRRSDPDLLCDKEGGDAFDMDQRWMYELEVKVLSARGLRDADWAPGGGGSDPYCICEIVGKGVSKFRTKTIGNNHDPVWNESGKITGFHHGDGLRFTIMDEDVGKSDDLLGRVTLESEQLLSGCKRELKLKEAGASAKDKVNAYLTVSVSVIRRYLEGPSIPKPPHLELGPMLEVTIFSARGLRDADWFPGGGGSDPYCICEIQGKGTSKFQTKTIDNCNDPVWNKTSMLEDFCKGDDLLFTVYDKDVGKADDLLGKVLLPGNQILDSKGFKGELKLMFTGATAKSAVDAYVKVGVKHRSRSKDKVASAKGAVLSPSKLTLAPTGSCETSYQLEVKILSAKGLRDADWGPGGGGSDPYCICEVQGAGKKLSKFRTKTIDNDHDPVWNETGLIADFTRSDVLLFTIFDEDFGKADDLLGKIALGGDAIFPIGFRGELKLKHTGATAKDVVHAVLKVSIKVKGRG